MAVKWVLEDEDRAREAADLRAATVRSGEAIVAPTLLPYEVANVVHQRVRRREVKPEDGLVLIDRFLALPIRLAAPPGLHRRALALAAEFGLPASYDAHYLALAELADCDLWTDDRRLLRGVGNRFARLRWIGEARL